ncbi:MAG: response regulator [Gammaproteobacteria bacterium]|nr:response regulator [Gammaproteobacteria bacterium]MCP5137146.1 response regulator [Gammaproteobacteria bacterium]
MPRESLKRILYVEDEASMRTIVQVALEDVGGFVLRVCHSGAEALASVVEFRPQLILLDVMMPVMTGPQLLENLRTIPEAAKVPVIFMTALDDEDEIEKFRSMGVVDVILKPIDPATLAEDIREIWDEMPDH